MNLFHIFSLQSTLKYFFKPQRIDPSLIFVKGEKNREIWNQQKWTLNGKPLPEERANRSIKARRRGKKIKPPLQGSPKNFREKLPLLILQFWIYFPSRENTFNTLHPLVYILCLHSSCLKPFRWRPFRAFVNMFVFASPKKYLISSPIILNYLSNWKSENLFSIKRKVWAA